MMGEHETVRQLLALRADPDAVTVARVRVRVTVRLRVRVGVRVRVRVRGHTLWSGHLTLTRTLALTLTR